jgi:hypothetical protein
MLGSLALVAAAPFLVGPTQAPYSEAGTAVLAFVLSLLAMTAGVGSLAVREALVRGAWAGALDPRTSQGASRMLRNLLGAWVLCLIVGSLGSVLAWASARPTLGWPYVLAAAALLLFHAPRAVIFGRAGSDTTPR